MKKFKIGATPVSEFLRDKGYSLKESTGLKEVIKISYEDIYSVTMDSVKDFSQNYQAYLISEISRLLLVDKKDEKYKDLDDKTVDSINSIVLSAIKIIKQSELLGFGLQERKTKPWKK